MSARALFVREPPCPRDPFNGTRADRPCMCDRCLRARETPATFTPCLCKGSVHVVCRRWTVSTVKDVIEASILATHPKPSPRPKTWDCGCRGRQHVLCDPTWARMQDRPTVAPAKRMTLRQAVKDGMTLRPHAEHVYTCPPWCDGDDKDHEHPCLCDTSEIRWNRRFNHARPFASHERGQTFRVPVPA